MWHPYRFSHGLAQSPPLSKERIRAACGKIHITEERETYPSAQGAVLTTSASSHDSGLSMIRPSSQGRRRMDCVLPLDEANQIPSVDWVIGEVGKAHQKESLPARGITHTATARDEDCSNSSWSPAKYHGARTRVGTQSGVGRRREHGVEAYGDGQYGCRQRPAPLRLL